MTEESRRFLRSHLRHLAEQRQAEKIEVLNYKEKIREAQCRLDRLDEAIERFRTDFGFLNGEMDLCD